LKPAKFKVLLLSFVSHYPLKVEVIAGQLTVDVQQQQQQQQQQLY